MAATWANRIFYTGWAFTSAGLVLCVFIPSGFILAVGGIPKPVFYLVYVGMGLGLTGLLVTLLGGLVGLWAYATRRRNAASNERISK